MRTADLSNYKFHSSEMLDYNPPMNMRIQNQNYTQMNQPNQGYQENCFDDMELKQNDIFFDFANNNNNNQFDQQQQHNYFQENNNNNNNNFQNDQYDFQQQQQYPQQYQNQQQYPYQNENNNNNNNYYNNNNQQNQYYNNNNQYYPQQQQQQQQQNYMYCYQQQDIQQQPQIYNNNNLNDQDPYKTKQLQQKCIQNIRNIINKGEIGNNNNNNNNNNLTQPKENNNDPESQSYTVLHHQNPKQEDIFYQEDQDQEEEEESSSQEYQPQQISQEPPKRHYLKKQSLALLKKQKNILPPQEKDLPPEKQTKEYLKYQEEKKQRMDIRVVKKNIWKNITKMFFTHIQKERVLVTEKLEKYGLQAITPFFKKYHPQKKVITNRDAFFKIIIPNFRNKYLVHESFSKSFELKKQSEDKQEFNLQQMKIEKFVLRILFVNFLRCHLLSYCTHQSQIQNKDIFFRLRHFILNAIYNDAANENVIDV